MAKWVSAMDLFNQPKATSFRKRAGMILLFLVSRLYSQAINDYTIDHLKYICDNQNDYKELRHAFANFRAKKEEENTFIKQASTLSAAAVLATLAWPATADAVWFARLVWYTSLFMSIFGLITSAPARLVQLLPGADEELEQEHLSDEASALEDDMSIYLDIFLEKLDVAQPGTHSAESAGKSHQTSAENKTEIASTTLTMTDDVADVNSPSQTIQHRYINIDIVWVLQMPFMLMSWSWAHFIVGYFVFLGSPILLYRVGDAWTIEHTIAILTCLFGGLIFVDYLYCAFVANQKISRTVLRIKEHAQGQASSIIQRRKRRQSYVRLVRDDVISN